MNNRMIKVKICDSLHILRSVTSKFKNIKVGVAVRKVREHKQIRRWIVNGGVLRYSHPKAKFALPCGCCCSEDLECSELLMG